MTLLKYTLIAFFSFAFCFAKEADFKQENLDLFSGLPTNSITDIFQDSYGIFWIGTPKGLVKYNGKEFINYGTPPSADDNLYNNTIKLIKEGSNNNLWISTPFGHYQFNRYENKYDTPTLKQSRNQVLNDVLVDKNNEEWICFNNSPGVYNYTQNRYFYFSDTNSNETPTSIIELDSNKFLVSVTNEGLYLLLLNRNRSDFEYKKLIASKQEIFILKKQPNQALAYSSNTRYHIYTDKTGNTMVDATQRKNSAASSSQLIFDTYKDLYLLEKNTLYKFNADNTNLHVVHQFKNTPNKVLFDNNNNIWSTTTDNGIKVLYPNKKSDYKNTTTFSDECFGAYKVNDILPCGNNILLIATHGSGLINYDLKNNICRPVTLNNYLPENDFINQNRISFIFPFKPSVYWIGNETMGLYQYDVRKNKINKFFSSQSIRKIQDEIFVKILKQSKDTYWFATKNKGVYQIDLMNDRIINHYFADNTNKDLSLPSNTINDMALGSDETLWIATDKGLFQLKNNKAKVYTTQKTGKNHLWSNQVNCLTIDTRGNVWIGTNKGLNRYSQRVKSIKRYEQQANSVMPDIKNIHIDTNNYLWVLNNNSLEAFKLNNNNDISFSSLGGYIPEGSATNNFYPGKDNTLFLINESGLMSCNTEDYYFKKREADVYLEKISTAHPTILDEDIIIPLEVLDSLETVKLNPLQNTFSISFASLEYTNARHTMFSFKLNGFDSKWQIENEHNKVTYANIPAGEYTLNYKAYNKAGKWYSEEKSIRILISPPFWKTTEFKTVIAIMGLFVIFLIPFYVVRRNEKQKKALEKLVNKRTDEINKQNKELQEQSKKLNELNHTKDKLLDIIAHDLKDPFGQILGFSTLLNRNYNKYTDEKRMFQISLIQLASQNFSTLLENLLSWARAQTNRLNYAPQKTELSERIKEAISQVSGIANSKEISVVFSPEHDYDIYADTSLLNITLRNLITNAIKFTDKGGLIIINTKEIDHAVEISVQDNGIGITEEAQKTLFQFTSINTEPGTFGEKGTGLGLQLCKEVVKLNKGEIWFYSKPEQGSVFYFTVPISEK